MAHTLGGLTGQNGFEMVTQPLMKIANANNKVDSSQSHPLRYLGGNHHNYNGK